MSHSVLETGVHCLKWASNSTTNPPQNDVSPVPSCLAVWVLHILPDEIALLQRLHLLEELGSDKLFGQEVC